METKKHGNLIFSSTQSCEKLKSQYVGASKIENNQQNMTFCWKRNLVWNCPAKKILSSSPKSCSNCQFPGFCRRILDLCDNLLGLNGDRLYLASGVYFFLLYYGHSRNFNVRYMQMELLLNTLRIDLLLGLLSWLRTKSFYLGILRSYHSKSWFPLWPIYLPYYCW